MSHKVASVTNVANVTKVAIVTIVTKSRKCHKKSQMSQKVAKVANVKVHSKTPNCIVCISGFYTGWLLPAAVVGVMVFLYGVFTMNSNTIAVETCSKGDEYRMCPLCEECDYWKLIDICLYKRIAYLFDHPGTVFYAIFMSFWGKTHSILLLSLACEQRFRIHQLCSMIDGRGNNTVS